MKNNQFYRRTFSLLFLCTVFIINAQDIAMHWELITPKYETADAFVAGINVMDHGADPTGAVDQTSLFQELLDVLGTRTINTGRKSDGTPNGGVLYIPEGKYLLKGTLVLPKGVTIRGEWEKPVKGQPIKGTILMPANPNAKGRDCTMLPNGQPGTAYEQLSMIIMQPSSAVRDLNIWYPEQEADNIVAYPPAILFGQQGYWGNDYCLASNITLVNAYDGIIFSRRSGGGAPNCYGIYGTPLRRGIEIDNIAEVGRVDNVDFSPDYWSGSGLPNAPSKSGSHVQFIKENATAMVIRRNDWSYIGKINAEGYHTGYRLDLSYNDDVNGNKTAPNGHNYGMTFTDCKYGVYVAAVAGAGMMFYDYTFTDCDFGFFIEPRAGGIIQIQGSSFDTKRASLYAPEDNNTKIIISQNTIDNGPIDIRGGMASISHNLFNNEPDQVRLGVNARAVVTSNEFTQEVSIKDVSLYCPTIDHTSVEITKLPVFPYKNQYDFVQKPAKHAFYLATDLGVSISADDNSAALQSILNQAGDEGGGVVYLPPGHYKFREAITIPSGVELKGSVDIPRLPMGPGTVMEIYAGKDDEAGDPFITMEPESGLRGLVMNYPEQVVQLLTEAGLNNLDMYHYPYAIRGNRDVYIVNIALRACYKGVDLFTNKCDNHFVDYLAGHVFKNGIHVGGNSDGGHVYNLQFNQIAYGSGGETKFGAWPNSPNNTQADQAAYRNEYDMSYAYCWNHLDFITVENCTNQVFFNNFDFGSNRGFVLKDGANGISLGQGIDQGMHAFHLDGVGNDGFNFINTQIVTTAPSPGVLQTYRDNNRYIEATPNLNNKVVFFGADFWGQPQNISNNIQGGEVELQASNYSNSGQRTFASIGNEATFSLISTNINSISSLLSTGSAPQFNIQSSFVNQGNVNPDNAALWINNLTQTSSGPTPCGFDSKEGWIATASTSNSDAPKGIDGDANTRWSTLSERQKPGQWYMVDMLESKVFNTIFLDAGGVSYRPVSCVVAVSNDGMNWTEVATATNATLISFEKQTVQYIKITQTGNSTSSWRIAEFYIKDTELPPMSTQNILQPQDVLVWFDKLDNLHIKHIDGMATVNLYTLSGNLIYSAIQLEDSQQINLPSGVYIALIHANNTIYRKKLIKP